MSRPRMSAIFAAVCLCLAGPGAIATPAVAGASRRIGPNQFFTGMVNDRVANAPIMMACFGPIHPGETGHPSPGSTVEVHPQAGPLPGGFTGSAADHIFAYFVSPTPIPQGVNVTYYDVEVAIPTTFTLPCQGRGSVIFAPEPTSRTAQSQTVSVVFMPQP